MRSFARLRFGTAAGMVFVGTLRCAAAPREEPDPPIRVAENVRVSTLVDREHNEVHIAADPDDPQRLAACSIVNARSGGGNEFGGRTVLYVSHDGGRSWARGVEDSASAAIEGTQGPWQTSWDPVCAYGRDGVLYFATGTIVEDDIPEYRVRLHRSPDGGRTWFAPTLITSGFSDKPWLVVDTWPEGPYSDRVYLAYHSSVGYVRPGEYSQIVVASGDGGASFEPPVEAAEDARTFHGGVTLSDGALMLLTQSLGVLRSADGGQTFEDVSPPLSRNVLRTSFSMAADASDGPFLDRVYLAWSEVRDERQQIFVSYSPDQGRTWSDARLVSDDQSRPPPAKGPDNIMATVAVNADGIVGVSWYDRRDNPDNLGYYVRFSASLDGGDIWLPSVRVSEQPNVIMNPLDSDQTALLQAAPLRLTQPTDTTESTLDILIRAHTWVDGGHYAGLAASADGVFFPLWVDNRTGVKQVWTAPVRVQGRARPDPVLAGLYDASSAVKLTFNGLTARRTSATTGVLEGEVWVTNTSSDTLRRPLRLQVLRANVTSSGAPARAELDGEASYRLSASVWDLSEALDGEILPPGAKSAPVPIRFQLTELTANPEADYSGTNPAAANDAVFRLQLKARLFAAESRP